MNLELWNKGIDWIEEHPEEYDQSEPGVNCYVEGHRSPCQSPCCFLGAIGIVADIRGCWTANDLRVQVGDLLGIDHYEAVYLFKSYWPVSWFHYAGIKVSTYQFQYIPTSSQAIAILRGMAKDGRVWRRR